MDENKNIFEKFDSTSRDIMSRARSFFLRYFPYIMLIGNILFEVLSRLFRIGFTTPFTPAFFASLFINTVSTTLAYACFVFYAEKERKKGWNEYHANCRLWEQKSANVRLNRFDEFIQYCKAEYRRECEERRIAIIVNKTRISVKAWRETYRDMTDADIMKLADTGEITREDARWIIKANKPVKLRLINPLLILAGMKVGDTNDAGRRDTSSVKSVLFKPIPVLVMSIVGSMFAGQFIGFSDTSVFFDMLYTAFMICVSALMGYAKGTANAEKHNADIKGRIIFIERFEKADVPSLTE